MKTKIFVLALLSVLVLTTCSNNEERDDLYDCYVRDGYDQFLSGSGRTYEKGLLYADSALSLNPNGEEALFLKISLLELKKKHKESLVYLNRLLKLDPENHRAILMKADALNELNRLEEAIILYNKNLKFDEPPYILFCYYGLSKVYSKLKDKSRMLINLKNTIHSKFNFEERSREDSAFKEYWYDPDFIELTKE